jgi:hypothetical protein
MSHCDQILEALRDGQWHTTADIYRATGGFLILHSRISDLRKRGHNIEGRHVPGMTGADGYEYRLCSSVTFVDVPRVRRPVDLPLAVPAVGQLVIGDI